MKKFVVDGIEFQTEEDYNAAVWDLKQITHIRANIDLEQKEKLISVYNKAVLNKVFKSVVGMNFLKELQDIIIVEGYADYNELLPIPQPKQQTVDASEHKIEDSDTMKHEKWLIGSVVFNIVLLVVIVGMYLIAYNSKNANIINYERILNNKYEAMSESLSSEYNEKMNSLDENESSN